MIYLDYAAAVPLHPAALAAGEAATKIFANPAAAHAFGRQAAELIEADRQYLSSLLRPAAYDEKQTKAAQDALIFTSSLTEANNIIWQRLKALYTGTAEIFYGAADHPSLTMAAQFYQNHPTIVGRPIPLKQGRFAEDAFLASLGPATKLVLLSSVNNTAGIINPVARLSWEIKKRAPQAWLHVDHGQGFLKHPLARHCLDSIAIPSSKIGGPVGIAGLWVRNRAALNPWLSGGGHEFNLRASSLSLPLIRAFTAVVQAHAEKRAAGSLQQAALAAAKKQALMAALREKIAAVRFPWEEVDVPEAENAGPANDTSPYMLLAVFPQVSSDILMRYLEREEIMVAASSACSSHIAGHSPVLAALGLPESLHKNVLRFSWPADMDPALLRQAAERVAFHYEQLRRFAGR